MHLVTVTEPLSRGARLTVGSYLVDDINAGQLLATNPAKIQAQHVENPKPLGDLFMARSIEAPRILIIRTGGYGDLLFLAAAIRVFKTQNPGAHIAIATFGDHAAIFDNNPDIAEIIPYPVPLAIAETFDAILPLADTIEQETTLHAVDHFLEQLGVDHSTIPPEEKRCVYHPSDKELSAALSGFPRKLDNDCKVIPRLGVQVVAGSLNRTYPHTHLAEVMGMLHTKSRWEIFIFGEPKTLNLQEDDRLVNLSGRAMDFRHSAAVLATCDVVLAPDSALAHLAGALDLPCVALYGAFPYKLRTAYHPKTFALEGRGECAPCFHTGTSGDRWPAGKPCVLSGRCDVLASISPGRVANKVVALYRAAQRIEDQRTEEKLT